MNGVLHVTLQAFLNGRKIDYHCKDDRLFIRLGDLVGFKRTDAVRFFKDKLKHFSTKTYEDYKNKINNQIERTGRGKLLTAKEYLNTKGNPKKKEKSIN
jgi:hypothetical protein